MKRHTIILIVIIIMTYNTPYSNNGYWRQAAEG